MTGSEYLELLERYNRGEIGAEQMPGPEEIPGPEEMPGEEERARNWDP